MTFTQQHADENKAVKAAATLYMQNWSKSDLYDFDKLKLASAAMAGRFPGIPKDRVRHQTFAAAMSLRGIIYRKENRLEPQNG